MTKKLSQSCACGCGMWVTGEFAQGHDAKLYSELLTKVKEGQRAMSQLKARNWK